MTELISVLSVVAVLALISLAMSFRIVEQYEEGVLPVFNWSKQRVLPEGIVGDRRGLRRVSSSRGSCGAVR